MSPKSPGLPRSLRVTALAVLSALAPACADSPPSSHTDDRLAITVAPLALPGLTRACFDLRVTNAPNNTGDLVWARGTPGLNGGAGDPGALCSDTFGNGPSGDLSYVGPCDASGQLDADPATERINSVTLWLDGLYTASGYLAPDAPTNGWRDPCENGCTLDVLCAENADARVDFDLTVLRDANQGFFDVVVTFDDLFCSAKVDCIDDQGAPLALLFDPITQTRRPTVVATLACTAGPGTDVDTVLYRTPLVVTCGATRIELDPTRGPGNAYTPTSPDPAPTDPVWQYAVYAGQEALACASSSCNKVYWNIAIGLDLAADECTLTTTMTAADRPLFDDLKTPLGHVYPTIDIAVPLTNTAGLVCTRHPLHGNNGVATSYTRVDQQTAFAYAFDGTTFTTSAPPDEPPPDEPPPDEPPPDEPPPDEPPPDEPPPAPPTPTSCAALLQQDPDAGPGPHPIDPDGAGPIAPFNTTCDMSTDGGGWTLVANQVPSALFSTLTTADINPQNDGSLTQTFRLGNARIQALTPTVAWRMTSHNALGQVVDRAFFRPTCTIDWLKMVGTPTADCSVAPTVTTPTSLDLACGIAYTTPSFGTQLSAYTAANCALGIGQNNSGGYCSMRMGTTPWGTVPSGAALPCNSSQVGTLTMRLWVK